METKLNWKRNNWNQNITVLRDDTEVGSLKAEGLINSNYVGHLESENLYFKRITIWSPEFEVLDKNSGQIIGELKLNYWKYNAEFRLVSGKVYSWIATGFWVKNWHWKAGETEILKAQTAKSLMLNSGTIDSDENSKEMRILALTGLFIQNKLYLNTGSGAF